MAGLIGMSVAAGGAARRALTPVSFATSSMSERNIAALAPAAPKGEAVERAQIACRGSCRGKRPRRGHHGHHLDQDMRNPQRLGDDRRREHLRMGDEHVRPVVKRLACGFDDHSMHHGANDGAERAHRCHGRDALIFDHATEVDTHAGHGHAVQVGAGVVWRDQSDGVAVGGRATCEGGERFHVAPRPAVISRILTLDLRSLGH